LSSFLPFAKRKQTVFWVWDILSEAFPDDEEKMLACYSKALLCSTREEMLVNVRQKIASIFINRQMWNEAKTEILLIKKIRTENEWKIPHQIANWANQQWFSDAKENRDNRNIYREYAPIADVILYEDILEETVIVTFVNSDKKMLNFIVSDKKFGVFKYDRFLQSVRIGETLKVRFLKKDKYGCFLVATVKKYDNSDFKKMYTKEFQGTVKINEDRNFGFVDDVYLTSGLCSKNGLTNGCVVNGNAIKSFDKKKNQWGWKAYEICTVK
jgi:hypothetical protein